MDCRLTNLDKNSSALILGAGDLYLMTKAIQINEVYVANKKQMIPMEKGILSIDTAAAIDAFRKAVKAEEKALREAQKKVISKTCKSK